MRLHEAATADGNVVASVAVPQGSGFFVPPTLFGGLADDHALVREEQFAPIVPLMRYSDVDDAVRRANDSPYGLTASVWSADHDGAVAVACRRSEEHTSELQSLNRNAHAVLSLKKKNKT